MIRIKRKKREILITKTREIQPMTKDSQIDNKKRRKQKSRGQTPLTAENQNQNRTTKKQSAKRGDV
jgi:hypothetical protein